MRTETPQTIRLEDYAPYPFDFADAALEFDLDPQATRVRLRASVRRNAPGGEAPLRLDGETLKLVSIAIDGEPLGENAYCVDETGLTVHAAPDAFTLETEVEIAPAANTALSGLYISGGRYCTQCEATGFRRITYWPDRPDVMSRFRTRIQASAKDFPTLLSNGAPVETGELADQRHFAVWDDPHPKPSYLFALCAGDYDVLRDSFTTASGREVALAIHVDQGEAAKAAWAMDCLKRSMRWDEEVYGREYDLGVFNIVAVRDFNFGAMENKGLNIFNSAYVLADEATATDADFEAIESIVAHEYFHNWTGNRVTCRDWFQLCLKEGLTVFRDQRFSADMRSPAVQRIKDVIRLRARQFPEDAGPLAHPVRPSAYGSIDNLYTATVYEKGAELIGMLKTLIGDAAYRAGMDLYFQRHDGEAVTIEDFYACFEQASGRDLSDFRLWYAQPGTPHVTVEETWHEGEGLLELRVSQTTPPTSGRPDKRPVPIPLACALLDGAGGQVEADGWPGGEQLVLLSEETLEVEARVGIGAPRPRLSVNRGFSAAIRVNRDLGLEDRIDLARAETDRFNRWDLFQGLARDEILRLAADAGAASHSAYVDALAGAAEADSEADPAFAALILRLPDAGELLIDAAPADPVALDAARRRIKADLAARLSGWIGETLDAPSPAPFRPDAAQAGQRALRAAAMDLLAAGDDTGAPARLKALFDAAPNMTERLAALRTLARLPKAPERAAALAAFHADWRADALVLDKWFAAQAASADAASTQALLDHPDFDLSNPNRVRAVAGVFAMQNLPAFHAADGAGHALLERVVREADPRNPALAARLLTAFEQWRMLEPTARASAEAALKRLAEAELSSNAADIVSRALADA